MLIKYKNASFADAELLVEIRVGAMRESLERIGRFDPGRARDRFLSSYDPSSTRMIFLNDVVVGFFMVKANENGLNLDHLYIDPSHQGIGIGAQVLAYVFADADEKQLPVNVGALRDSDSNRFYVKHGFVKVGEAEWDIYYVRPPQSASASFE